MQKQYTYHNIIFLNYLTREDKKIYLIPSIIIDNDSDLRDWGIINYSISIYFLFFGISYMYVIDRYDFYEFKKGKKFRIFGLKFLNKTN